MNIPKKSRTKGVLIPVIIFEFHNWASLWFTKDQFNQEGGYKGVLKSQCIPISEIKKLHKLAVNPMDMPTCDWEP